MRKGKYSSLEAALEYIQFEKEMQNYKVYQLLRILVAKKYKLSLQYLEKSKAYKAVEARMILYSLLKKYTSYNYRMIGYLFNMKHHSKVYYLIKLINEYLQKNLYKNSILANYYEIEFQLKNEINFNKTNSMLLKS